MRVISTAILMMACSFCIAQKHDCRWTIGYGSGDPFYALGGVDIDFNQTPFSVTVVNRSMDFFQTVCSMCDSTGNHLYYSNGEYVADRNGVKMPHSDSLNTQWAGVGFGYYVAQGMLSFVLPDTANIYWLFHIALEYDPHWSTTEYKGSLWYSTIDMTLNNGMGDMVEKNKVIIDGGLIENSYLTACKHANGKDWWIVVPKKNSNGYHKVLFTGKGVQYDSIQFIGDTNPPKSDGNGMACFSPDGTKYAFFDTDSDIFLFDFNRCTGELSNFKHIPVVDSCNYYPCLAGLAFSPNSRFLYIPSTFYMYQMDIQAPDIEASTVLLAELDDFKDTLGYPTPFYFAQLAPDGKIYVANYATTYFYHVVNAPDSAGLACNFNVRGLQLPTASGYSMPHFPNYRLGPIDCDSISSVSQPLIPITTTGLEIKVFPNPASHFVVLKTEAISSPVRWQLFDAGGRAVRSIIFYGRKQIDLNGLPSGNYWWAANQEGNFQRGQLTIK